MAALKTTRSKKTNHTQGELHPRNPHRAAYDFPRLVQACPELKRFIRPHLLGGETVDFAEPEAVKLLNRALLKTFYGVAYWDLPDGFLCPPVPSRADYLHHAADLLAVDFLGQIPRGPQVRVLDIGAGANCIYPLIGTHEFGWRFVGTDVDASSVKWASQLVSANSQLTGKIECRLQPESKAIFRNVLRAGEDFALSICNPPFHASPAEAAAGTLRKLRNLGGGAPVKQVLNFGGRANELWCDGGEAGFVRRMIKESASDPERCVWFTTLVSKRGNLPTIEHELRRVPVREARATTMFAGQKQSRLVAWTFQEAAERLQKLKRLYGKCVQKIKA